MGHRRGQINHNFNGFVGQDFFQGQGSDTIFFRLRLNFIRVAVISAHHIQNLEL